MAQDRHSRRLTVILSASLAAVVALGIWIAVLIGRAQPDSDPQAPTTTSDTSPIEASDELTGDDVTQGDVGGDDDQTTVQETVSDTAPTPQAPVTSSEITSTEPVPASTSDDAGSGDGETSGADDGRAVSSDPTEVQQTAP